MQQNPDLSQLIQLAQSPAGQQLIRLLRDSGGENLRLAMADAARGDYTSAAKLLPSLLADPKAAELLKQLEGKP